MSYMYGTGEWILACPCEGTRSYDIAIAEFECDPLKWLRQLSYKTWFDPKAFMLMARRFRSPVANETSLEEC